MFLNDFFRVKSFLNDKKNQIKSSKEPFSKNHQISNAILAFQCFVRRISDLLEGVHNVLKYH